MNVKNMKSDKGNSVANQFIIYSDDGIYFQSENKVFIIYSDDGYNSIICKRTILTDLNKGGV